jgi:hypothetical protein
MSKKNISNFLPRLISEDKFPQLEISQDDAFGVGLVNSRDNLAEQGPSLRFSQPPSRPDVGVEVCEAWREEEVGLTVADDDFVNGVDVGMPVHPVVSGQHASSDGIVFNNLER